MNKLTIQPLLAVALMVVGNAQAAVCERVNATRVPSSSGDVRLAANGCYWLDADATVSGSVTVDKGATLYLGHPGVDGDPVAKRTQISGNLTANACVKLDGFALIGGSLVGTNCSDGIFLDYSSVAGNVRLQGNRSVVVQQWDTTSESREVGVGGNMIVSKNGKVRLSTLNVLGGMTVTNNGASSEVVWNAVGGTLQCGGNASLFTSDGNTAARLLGQCK